MQLKPSLSSSGNKQPIPRATKLAMFLSTLPHTNSNNIPVLEPLVTHQVENIALFLSNPIKQDQESSANTIALSETISVELQLKQ